MKIFVTGGAGYKGVLLATELLKHGHDVVIADNFMYGYTPVLHLVAHPRLTIRQWDIRNASAADLSDSDVVVHLAGISGMPACAANPNSAELINVHATRRIISLIGSGQLLIYASTTSIYGASPLQCDETVPIHPPSLYAKTKYEAENIVMERDNSISLRFATIFGMSPRMRADLLVNDFTYKAVNDRSVVIFGGRSKRTFVHILDAISAYLFSIDNVDRMKNQIYNVGDETLNFSKRDIADAIRRHVNYEIIETELADLDVRDFLVSFEKIRALGYKVKYSLDDGIRELLKLYSFYKVHSHFSVI